MPTILRARSVLAVRDLARSARFYIEVLGFVEDPIQAPGWRFLSKDACALMLGECRDEVPASETGNHAWFLHLLVDDVDAYYRDVVARGAATIDAPADRAYGLREFVLQTPDGHRMVVGQAL
ncbi:MAG: VOC family protein [Gemmatimonadota bacterium]|nr:VOC family protein [Gemmatimonadota bacterium]